MYADIRVVDPGFPRGGTNPWEGGGGASLLFDQFFSGKLHKNEEILMRGASPLFSFFFASTTGNDQEQKTRKSCGKL